MGWVLMSSVFFPAILLSSASSLHECCCTEEGVVWVSRGAYWDTELSEVYRSVDAPPQGKPSVWETVVTSVTWTGMFFKMETGIQKEKHQGEMRGLLISTTKTQLQSDTENHGTHSTVPSRHRDSSGTVSFQRRSHLGTFQDGSCSSRATPLHWVVFWTDDLLPVIRLTKAAPFASVKAPQSLNHWTTNTWLQRRWNSVNGDTKHNPSPMWDATEECCA